MKQTRAAFEHFSTKHTIPGIAMETIIALTLLLLLCLAIYVSDRIISRGWNKFKHKQIAKPLAIPPAMPLAVHWSRTTAVVERSLKRAISMSACHASAASQLDAAEYALHALISELGQVMAVTVASPLAPAAARTEARSQVRTSLAA
jgi:hypothetical protein